MASSSQSVVVNIDDCNGEFDLDAVPVYNMVNVGRFIINSFENTFNFCVTVGLLNQKRKCSRCRVMLKLCVDSREQSRTPLVLRCYKKSCRKDYYSLRQGTFFDKSNLSLQQILLLANLFCGKVTAYEQMRYEAQLSNERLSDHTIADWLSYCREVCLEMVSSSTTPVPHFFTPLCYPLSTEALNLCMLWFTWITPNADITFCTVHMHQLLGDSVSIMNYCTCY